MTIKKVFARVLKLGQQPWVRIFLNKQFGIVNINPNKNSKYNQLLESLSKQYYNLVFLQLNADHPEYKAALRTFTISDEQNIIAVDKNHRLLLRQINLIIKHHLLILQTKLKSMNGQFIKRQKKQQNDKNLQNKTSNKK